MKFQPTRTIALVAIALLSACSSSVPTSDQARSAVSDFLEYGGASVDVTFGAPNEVKNNEASVVAMLTTLGYAAKQADGSFLLTKTGQEVAAREWIIESGSATPNSVSYNIPIATAQLDSIEKVAVGYDVLGTTSPATAYTWHYEPAGTLPRYALTRGVPLVGYVNGDDESTFTRATYAFQHTGSIALRSNGGIFGLWQGWSVEPQAATNPTDVTPSTAPAATP